jgi:hypothetical protein
MIRTLRGSRKIARLSFTAALVALAWSGLTTKPAQAQSRDNCCGGFYYGACEWVSFPKIQCDPPGPTGRCDPDNMFSVCCLQACI